MSSSLRFKVIWAADVKWKHLLLIVVLYIYCVIDVFIKCAWVKPLPDKKTETVPVLYSFDGIVNESERMSIGRIKG